MGGAIEKGNRLFGGFPWRNRSCEVVVDQALRYSTGLDHEGGHALLRCSSGAEPTRVAETMLRVFEGPHFHLGLK